MNEFRGKVRVVFLQNPLPMHNNAMAAAEAAAEAHAQGKFWRYHDLLFQNQQQLDRAGLERFAEQAGLDMTRLRASLDNHTHQAEIQQDMRLAAQVGARGTPNFFINGRQLPGAVPVEQFRTIIREEVQRAERMLATGVSRDRLYFELTKIFPTTPAPPAQPDPSKQPPQPPRQVEDPNAVYRVPVGASPTRGPANALVTIVEFTDFQ